MSKRGEETLLFQRVIFIILNLIFFSMLIIFVFRTASGAALYEQAYSKQIALLIDSSEKNTEISINFTKALDVAKKNDFSVEDIVFIDGEKNKVNVRLASQGGYSYQFFSDYDVLWQIKDDTLFLTIK